MTGRQTFGEGRPRPQRKKRAVVPDRYQMLVDGVITVDDLDDEELLRGQMRNSMGTFSGSPPRAIPWSMHRAAMDRIGSVMERRLANSIGDILENLTHIASGALNATGRPAPADAQVKAAIYLADRVLGKTADRQEITATVTARWEEAVGDGTLFVDVLPDSPASSPVDDAGIVDAEIVEEPVPALGSSIELEVGPVSAVGDTSPDRAQEAGPQDGAPAARPRPQRKVRPKTGVKL